MLENAISFAIGMICYAIIFYGGLYYGIEKYIDRVKWNSLAVLPAVFFAILINLGIFGW